MKINPIQERDIIGPEVGKVSTSSLAAQAGRGTSREPIRQTKSYLMALEKQQLKAKQDAENLLRAKAKNDIANETKQAAFKVSQSRGENAFTTADKVQGELRTKIDEVVTKVPESMREQVKLDADAEIRGYNQIAQGHQFKEYKTLQDNTYKTRQEFLIENAVMKSADLAAFDESLATIDGNTEEYFISAKGGIDGEMSDLVKTDLMANQLKARSTAVRKTVESYATLGDMDKANLFAHQYKNTVTGSDQIAINKLLQTGQENAVDNRAKGLFDSILDNANGNEMVALKQAQEITGSDGKLFNKVSTMLKSHYAVARTNENIARDHSLARASQSIMKGGSINLATLDPRDRPKAIELMKKQSTGDFNTRDHRVYNEVYQRMLISPEDFADPSKTILDAYAYGLAKEDLTMFKSRQIQMQERPTDSYSMRSVDPIVRQYVKAEEARGDYRAERDYSKLAQIEASVRSKAVMAMDNVRAKLGDKASITEIEKAFRAEMATKMVYQVKRNKKGFVDRVLEVFDGEAEPGAAGRVFSPEKEIVDEEAPGPLYETSERRSAVLDRNDPLTQQVIGVLEKQYRRAPTEKETLDGLRRLKQNRAIRQNQSQINRR